MKRIISNVMLVAAAAMAFFACQKPEVIVPEFEEVNGLAFSSEKPSFDDETKTEWTGESIQWSAGDKIRVAYTCDGVWQNADGTSKSSEENGSKTAKIYESKAITEAGSTAFFSVPGYFKGTAEGVYEFYGIYPSSLVSGADIKYAPSVTITIPTTQTPTASSFDSAADVMASKSQSYVGIPKEGENNGPISLKWERLVAHGHLTLKNLAVEGEEDIQTITLTANADADMVGTHYLYLDTYNVVKPNSNAAPNSITIDARNLSIDSEGNITFWASFLPCTWTSIDVKVETDKASYTREIDLSSNQKTFAKNARNILAVNMASALREAKSSNPLPFVKDFSDKTGTAGFTELDGFTVSGSVYNAAGAIRLAKGDAGGSITTQPLDLSGNFHVKVTASGWDSDELSLIVSSGDQSETVTLSAVGNGNSGPGECAEHIINFQPVSNSSSVTFEASAGKRCYIKKIEILEGHAVAAPVLKATAPNEIAAAGGEGSFNFTLANPQDGQSVSAESNVDWITGESVNGNTVTYTVAENTSEEPREGTITLSYEGAQSVNVVIAQAGKPAEGGEAKVEVWSWAGGGKANFTGGNIEKTYGLGSDYADQHAPYQIKMDGTGDYFIIKVDGSINSVSVGVKMIGGGTTSTLDVQGSSDGESYSSVEKLTISGSQNAILELQTTKQFDPSYRYLKFYFTKGSNIGVGPISITYTVGSESGGENPEPDEPETPVDPIQLTMSDITCSAQTENSLTFTWTAVANATGYEVTCNNKTETVNTTQYVATDLVASTSYTISIVAVGDGTNYTNSVPKTQTGKTKEAQQAGGSESVETFNLKYSATDVKSADWSITQNGVSLYWSKGTSSNTPSPNKEGSVRMYTGTTLTINAPENKKITRVVFTPTSSTYNATKLKYNNTSLTTDDWQLTTPANQIVLTAGANARFKEIKVYYN